jgi:hypothetical protein
MRRPAALLLCLLCLPPAWAQTNPPDPRLFDAKPGDPTLYTFGVTVVSTAGFRGDIYRLKPNTKLLPNFKRLKPVGSIYTRSINVPPRAFDSGFPGVADLVEWFAIDYHGRFWIETPGKYRFALGSDDGSRLLIDGKLVIDNDGTHAPKIETGGVTLKRGVHRIRVSYFQGPRYQVALVLAVTRPGDEDQWRVFHTDDFRPANPDDWPQEKK